jgi:hypothetical protein
MSKRKLIIKREAVDSETLASVGYNEEARILQVELKDNSVYNYLDVPPYIYADLLAAEDRGKFFAVFIRTHYEYEQVLS